MKTYADFGIDLPPGRTGEVALVCPRCVGERRKKTSRPLSVNTEKACWHCNHCGWAGGLDGRDGYHEPSWRKPQWRKPEPTPSGALIAEAVEWFAKRGIGAAVLAANQIGCLSVYMPQLEDHADAIVFPYFRGGELINRKYRARGKTFRMDTGAERILYGLDGINPECVVIVEGEIDKLSVETAGVGSCLSVPDGAPAVGTKDYSGKFSFLDTAAAQLDPVKKFVLAVDNDEPGVMLEDELARRLGRERCWRVKWPTGCKDANDVLLKHGAEDLRWFIEHAEPYPIEGVFTTIGERDKVLTLYQHGFERGYRTGWASVDSHFTVRPGEFTVITGAAGSGKSNWVDALFVNLAERHGWSFGIFSPENQPLEDHMARMIEKHVGLPFSDGPTPRMSREDLENGIVWAGEHFYWMLPDDEKSWCLEWILARAKELVYRRGIRALVIDPWNELEAARDKSETETEYISRSLRTVRQWGRRHGVHVFMVVHPTKLRRGDNGSYPVPTLWDCAGSAHWKNKADNGLCIWRDENPESAYAAQVDVHVQKIRFRQIGRIGKTTLMYDKVLATYSEKQADIPYGAVGD